MIIILNYLSGKLFISTSFSSFFWGYFLFLHLEHILLSPHFCQIFLFYFYLLCWSIMFPNFGEMALCRRCLMGPRRTLPSDHQSYMLYSRPLCGSHGPFCCVGANYCGWTCWWGWPQAQLATRPCLMWWLPACWWQGRVPVWLAVGTKGSQGWCWPTWGGVRSQVFFFSLDSTCQRDLMVFVFLCLTYFL